jgi:hypothetical protein
MSNTRIKILSAESVEILEKHTNDFLSQEDIELKQLDYETDGYEKPYSVAILYHEKNEDGTKRQFWRDKIFNTSKFKIKILKRNPCRSSTSSPHNRWTK